MTNPIPPCPADAEPKAVFPLLADPAGYIACKWDLTNRAERRCYWLDLFHDHFPKLVNEAMRGAAEQDNEGKTREACAAAQAEFFDYLNLITQTPDAFGRLDILEICYQRERALRHHGIADPYLVAKRLENEQALTVLPTLLEELDALPEAERSVALIQGVFAGNIFDLGATKTVDMFKDERVNFHETRGLLKPRPWFMDGLDAWLDRLAGPPHRAAVLLSLRWV